MNIDLRVRAAAALLQLAFNPHQRRGPDGRWIKMDAGERRTSRSRSGRTKPPGPKVGAVAVENPDQHTARTAERAFERSMASDRIYTRFRSGEWFERYGTEANRVPEGVRDYFGNSERINAQLRTGKLEPGTQELVDQVDEAIEYTETKQPLLVYRGVNRDALGKAGVGDTVTDPGYWSTTMDPDQARKFARSANSVTMHIEIPAGTNVLAENTTETEVLLPRGSTIRIVSMDGDVVHAVLVTPEAPAAPAPPSAAPRQEPQQDYATRQAALAASVAAGSTDRRRLGGGAMGETTLVDLEDGTQAIRKRAKGRMKLPNDAGDWWTGQDQTDAEEYSALVADALGVRVPTTVRTGEREIYMERVEGQTAYDKYPHGQIGRVDLPPEILQTPDSVKLGLLDLLTNNPDRHGGNWMLDDQDNPIAIDHGLSFVSDWGRPTQSDAGASPFAAHHFLMADGFYRPFNSLGRGDPAKIRAKLEALRPQFQAGGREQWLDGMLTRLAAITRAATAPKDVY